MKMYECEIKYSTVNDKEIEITQDNSGEERDMILLHVDQLEFIIKELQAIVAKSKGAK
jgi:hypothetical protein